MSEDVLVVGDDAAALEREGIALGEAGRLAESHACFLRALQLEPASASTHRNLADLLRAMRRLHEAAEEYRAALEIEPQMTTARFGLAVVLVSLDQNEEAEQLLRHVVKEAPDLAPAHSTLGLLLAMRAQWMEAEASFRRALEIDPDVAETWSSLAGVLGSLGRVQDAAEAYRCALEVDPRALSARVGLAKVLAHLEEWDESQRLLEQVVEEHPGRAELHSMLGVLHLQCKRWEQAEVAMRRALELNPQLPLAHLGLANALYAQSRVAEMSKHLREASLLEPNNAMIRATQVVQTLPPIPSTREEANRAVDHFFRALREYSAWRKSCDSSSITFDSIMRTPFLLAYREGNHVGVLSKFADLVGPPRRFKTAQVPPARPKVRLGIVSDCFRRHSVWEVILKGLLSALDRSRFEVFIYSLGAVEDDQTMLAKSLCDKWVDAKLFSDPSNWATAIAEDKPDILYYPEVGMDAKTYLVARERLAPVQAVGWGHPITSGLPSMDMFLSGELLEPPPGDAQPHYRELLVRLPGTGACTMPFALTSESLPESLADELSQRPGPRILIPQMPFKIGPLFDDLLARIVEAVGPCTVLIPRSPTHPVYDLLATRIGAALRAKNCDPDTVLKFIPWLPRPQFATLLDEVDVVLDCPEFSGYTTARIAAHRGAPMVTLEGRCMRQRLAAGVYRKIGITDTVVHNEDEYVRVAAALALEGRNSPAGQARRQALRTAAPLLDNDLTVVRAFEQVLLQALEGKRSGPPKRTPVQELVDEASSLLVEGKDALATCEAALKMDPDDAGALEVMGMALLRAGRPDEALASVSRSVQLDPGSPSGRSNLGGVLINLDRPEEAIEEYTLALKLEPRLTKARLGLALARMALGERKEAARLLEQVVEEEPDAADAHCILGALWGRLKNWDQAEVEFRRALELNPALPDIHFNLAIALQIRDCVEEAETHLVEAIRLSPTNGLFRMAHLINTLPSVPKTTEQAEGAVVAFERALKDYVEWRASCGSAMTFDSIDRVPFYLAYRPGNHIELLSRFADEVGPPRQITAAPAVVVSRPKVRLGVVSEYFRNHSIWEVITKGMLTHLDRDRFEVCIYRLDSVDNDKETDIARSLGDRWVEHQVFNNWGEWSKRIADDQPDVLFYPGLGMDWRSFFIARERLAPVQAASWGHPITSGLSTVDLFLSGELMEPPEAQSHYREKLVLLPGTGTCTTALDTPREPLPERVVNDLAARPEPRILIPQTPFKMDPAFDDLLARIVQAIGKCTVIICRSPLFGDPAYRAVADRLCATLSARGIDPEAVLKFIPWQLHGKFHTLLDESDVVLDCTAFSGYTTARIAAHCGAPMVTLEGPFMRQRLAAAVYRRIGITDTVVHSEDEYLRMAVALAKEGRNSPAGRARRQAIRAAAPALDNDLRVVRAFEQVLLKSLEQRGIRR